MSPTQSHIESRIVIVPYNPLWPEFYAAERAAIIESTEAVFIEIEHIGSTSVPGLAAKPIIDIMASVNDLESVLAQTDKLARIGYADHHTDMPNRLLFHKHAPERGYSVHLHIVTADTWDTRNERLLRDYLLGHPEAARAYGDLKQRLAVQYADDRAGYTRAKTQFVQDVVDRARDARGLPRVDVWEE